MCSYLAIIPAFSSLSYVIKTPLEVFYYQRGVGFNPWIIYTLVVSVVIADISILYIYFFHKAIQARKNLFPQPPRRTYGKMCFPALMDQVNPAYPYGTRLRDGCTSCTLGVRLSITIIYSVIISLLGIGTCVAVVVISWSSSDENFWLLDGMDRIMSTFLPMVSLFCIGLFSILGKVAGPASRSTYITLAKFATLFHIAGFALMVLDILSSLFILLTSNVGILIIVSTVASIGLSSLVTIGISVAIFQLLESTLLALEDHTALDGGSNLPLLVA